MTCWEIAVVSRIIYILSSASLTNGSQDTGYRISMCSSLRILGQKDTLEVHRRQALLYRKLCPQHLDRYCAPVTAGSINMALTNVNLTEDSTGWYIYAWWFVSHELPTAYGFAFLPSNSKSVLV